MNRVTGRTGWLVSVTAILIATLGSPVLLAIFGKFFDADWVTVANVGDSYGFASAALAGLAFLGVSYSMLLQRHEVRASRMESHRQLQLELYRLAIDDVSFMEAFFGKVSDTGRQRQLLYINLWFQFLRTGYVEMGTTGEEELRGDIRGFFTRSELAIEYWRRSRGGWVETDTIRGNRDRRFFTIVEMEYQSASKDPVQGSESSSDNVQEPSLGEGSNEE